MKPDSSKLYSTNSGIDIYVLHGVDAKPFVNIIASFRISSFKKFPYLYYADIAEEHEYLNIYFNDKRSIIILAYVADECIGFASSIPLADEDESVIKPLLDIGLDLRKCLYIGECILLPQYQGLGLAKTFVRILETLKCNNEFDTAILLVVDRADSHPKKPEGYTNISVILNRLGYKIMPDVFTFFFWRGDDTGNITENKMLYYYKKLR